MLNKIFGLFRKNEKNSVTLTKPANPFANMKVNSEEIDSIVVKVENIDCNDVTKAAKDLGIKLKYRDTQTGELYEVEWTPENFNKVITNTNLCLVLG